MALAQLSIDLVAKVAAFERDIKRTADATVAQSQRMAVAFDLIKGGIAGIAAGFSAGALVTFVRTTVDAVDALNDVADATGATVENISALEDVAKRTGTNLDAVSGILVKFNSVLADADPTKGAGAVIKALNLDIEDLKRLDPAEALRQVAVALSGYADDGNKARAVQELFGKSVKEAAPFLKDLAENGQLNAKVTSEQAAEAEKFNKELFKLQANANDAARAIVGSLVPAINRIFDDVRTLGDKATLAGLAGSVIDLKRDLDILQEKRGNPFFNQDAIEKQIADITVKLNAAKKAFNDARGYRPAGGGRGFVNPPVVRPELEIPEEVKDPKNPRTSTTIPRDPYADANRYLETLRKQAQATQELTVYEKLLADLRVGALGKTTPAIESQLKDLARQIDADKEIADIAKQFEDLYKARDDKLKQDKDRLDALVGASETGRLEKQRQDLLFLADAYEKGRLGAVGSEEAMRKFAESAQAYLGLDASDAFDELSQAAIRASERIQDALGDTLVNVLDGDFKSIGDSFTQLLKRMAAEAAAAQIMDGLFGAIDPTSKKRGGGALGDFGKTLLSFLPSFDGGGYTGPGARTGGLDGKGGYLAMLHPRERVIDETKGQSAGAAQSITININATVGNVASQQDVVAGMQTVRAQILGDLQRSARYGGALAA